MEFQEELYSMNSMRIMEVIDINTGSKLGMIKDFIVDCEDYKILSILIPLQKVSWLSKENDIEIPWERIIKIGTDVILVDAQGLMQLET